MKIKWVANDGYGRFGFKAEPGEYDGVPPLDSLLFDGTPATISNDRMSAAAALAFGEFTSGELELPKDITPEVAGAVQDFLLPRRVFPGPVHFAARALPDGETRLLLNPGLEEPELDTHNEWGAAREVLLDLRPAGTWAGQLASVERISLATNAPLFGAQYAEDDVRRVHASIAVALIFAESLKARTLVLHRKYAAHGDQLDRLVQFLAPCGMGIDLR